MLAEGLWCAAFGRCDNPSIVHQIARPQPGTSAFSALLGETQARLEQLVDGGQWDPSDSDEGRELYEGRNELLATLRAPIDDSPDSFIEFQVAIDAGECSELAVAVLDVRTGAILLVHRLPLC